MQDEDEIERLALSSSPWFQAILEKSRQQFREGQWLSEEEFWRKLDAEYAETPEPVHARPKKRMAL
jgi:hypothetical protein